MTGDFRRHRRRARLRLALPVLGAAMLPVLAAGALMRAQDGSRHGANAQEAPSVAAAKAQPSESTGRAERIRLAAATGVRLPGTRPQRREATLTVRAGDTMMDLLQETGISRRDAFTAVRALKDVYAPRDLRPGQKIHLDLRAPESAESGRAPLHLTGLRLRASAETDVSLRRTGNGGFVAESHARELTRRPTLAQGRIDSSLVAAARAAEVPMAPLLTVIRSLSYAVDFQRDLRTGDGFEVLYERYTEPDGTLAKAGDVLYAALHLDGRSLDLYRFEQDNGRVGYFNAEGESVRRLLMRTPINGARLSSGYGMRHHPILGYSRMHKGVDFAAPTGTPVYAAGSGKVEYAGWNGGYGRYIRIRHNGRYKTAYAHLSRVAQGVHGGARVSQGDVIGYVGNTGQSTGPHLHYEIIKNGRKVNPRNLDLPTGYRLTGAARRRFDQIRKEIDALRRHQADPARVARAATD